MNKFQDTIVRKTLWLWLPFYALFRLTKEMAERGDKKS